VFSEGTELTKNVPSARLNPDTELANALMLIGVPADKKCGDTVVTVIKLGPTPAVPVDASVTQRLTIKSLPGIS